MEWRNIDNFGCAISILAETFECNIINISFFFGFSRRGYIMGKKGGKKSTTNLLLTLIQSLTVEIITFERFNW